MAKYEDLLEELREQGLEELATGFEEFKATALRQKAAERDQLAEKLEAAETKLHTLEVLPKREEALRQAGIDFDALRPAERELVRSSQFEADEPSKEEIAHLIEQYQLPVHVVDEGTPPPAAAVVAAARQAQSKPGAGVNTEVTPEDVSEWTTEKLMRFSKAHPQEWESLKQGEKVRVAFAG